MVRARRSRAPLDVPCRIPVREDLALPAIAHATMWSRNIPVRWITDVALLERSAPAGLDWEAILAAAQTHRLLQPTLQALDYAT